MKRPMVDGYGIANLRIGVGSDNWRVTAFARNLFDEEYLAEVIMAPEFGGAFVTPGTHRRAGVEYRIGSDSTNVFKKAGQCSAFLCP